MKESLFRIFRLLRVIMGTLDFDFSFGSKAKKKSGIGSKIFFAVILLIIIAEFGSMSLFLSIKAYDILAPFNLQSFILGVTVAAGSLLVFVFGIFYVTSIFYHTKDIERLLAMPLRPYEIVAAKFLSLVIFEYLTSVIVLIPFIVYGVKNGEGPLFYIYSLLVLLFLPIIPLTINSVIIMPVMRFIKFARNKDAFMTISSILLMVLILGVNFSIQRMAVNTDALAEGLKSSAGKIAETGTAIFPGSVFAAKALALSGSVGGALYILLFMAASAIAFGLVMLLAKYLYIQAASAVTSSYSGGKKLTNADMDKGLSGSGLFITYLKKEISLLIRTPIYFLNNVIINFLWPVIIGFSLFMPSDENSSKGIFEIIRSSLSFDSAEAVVILLFSAFAAGIFTGGTNGISATCLSREGASFNMMKIFPVSYFRQILIKCTAGIFFSSVGFIFIAAVFLYIAMPPLWVLPLILAAALPGIVFANLISVVFDLVSPKLHWDNEQKAVKQNINYMFAMFLSMGLGLAVVLFGVFVPLNAILKILVLIMAAVLFNVIMLYFLKGFAEKKMEEQYY